MDLQFIVLLLREDLIEGLRGADEDVGLRPYHRRGYILNHELIDQVLILLLAFLTLNGGGITISSTTGP